MGSFGSTIARASAIIILLAAAGAASAGTLASSGFGAANEGWSAVNGATSFEWVAAGGAEGGYVRATDTAGGALWFFTAPTAYTGDQSAAYGAALSFALRSERISAPIVNTYAQVQVLGTNGMLLTWRGATDPGTSWTSYSVKLDASAGWTVGSLGGALATEADVRSVLGGVQALRIRGDYGQGIDTTGLDSVSVVSTVPEPAAPVLMALGLAGLWAARRNRQDRRCD